MKTNKAVVMPRVFADTAHRPGDILRATVRDATQATLFV